MPAMQTFEQLEAEAHEACDSAPAVSVAQYFRDQLGAELGDICHAAEDGDPAERLPDDDENGLGMSLQTPCGVMCMHAIDRAAAFLPFAENSGDDIDFIATARAAVLVLIFG